MGWREINLSKYKANCLEKGIYHKKLKIGACYVLYNEEDYIQYSLDSIYKWADKIYILLGVPWEASSSKPDKTEEIIRSYIDPDKKIKIFRTDATDESICKNLLLRKCREDKMDYCWIVDGDEIYDDKYMRFFLKVLDSYRVEAIRGWAREHWRSLHHSPGLSEHFIMFKVLPDLHIRVRMPTRDVYTIHFPNDMVLFDHYGLARTPERMREKYTISKNRENKNHSFDLDKWMNEKFLAWEKNRNVTDIFPFAKGVWDKTHKLPDKDIPEIMKRHKWHGIDCIK